VSALSFTRLFGKSNRRTAAPPHPESLPRDAGELLAWFARWARTQGIACQAGHGALWVRLPGEEIRVDAEQMNDGRVEIRATSLLWRVMRPEGLPERGEGLRAARDDEAHR
jgi:hypothetical protein